MVTITPLYVRQAVDNDLKKNDCFACQKGEKKRTKNKESSGWKRTMEPDGARRGNILWLIDILHYIVSPQTAPLLLGCSSISSGYFFSGASMLHLLYPINRVVTLR